VTIRACAITGLAASVLWLVALVVEYQFDLLPPGNGSSLYRADQAAFALAELGYLVLLIGILRARAGGDTAFGRISIGIWAFAIAALVIGQFLALLGIVVAPLLPIGGLGQLIGSILAAIAIWRAGRWTGWRRFAPAIWALYTLMLFLAIATGLPGLATPTGSPTELAEAGWQVAWFLVALALTTVA